MLQTKRTTMIEGMSMKDDAQLATFYANIDKTTTTINMNTLDNGLYESNKDTVRKDKAEFDDYVYGLEDEIKGK